MESSEKYINRDLEKVIKQLSKEYPCILLTGPRQVGKTTLFQHIDNRKLLSLDDVTLCSLAKSDPKMFLDLYNESILIDEVQYAPELFSYIKIKIDQGASPSSFFLTGSQSFSLMKLAQESLAGRVAILNLSSISLNEILSKDKVELKPFSLNLTDLQEKEKDRKVLSLNETFELIFNGSMPALISKKYTNRQVFYSSYIQTYLLRDIKDEIEIKDNYKFLDFLRSCAVRTAQELNIHSIANDVAVSDDTVDRWISILEKAQIIFKLHPYSNNLLKRTIKSPKLYFFDTGLVSYLAKYPNSETLAVGQMNGQIFENFAVNEIRKTFLNTAEDPYLYYYRDKDKKEIDLICESYDGLDLIEIKKTSTPKISMTKNFEVFSTPGIKVNKRAIVCLADRLSALDNQTLIVPLSLI